MARTIRLQLNEKSISSAIDEVREYQAEVKRKVLEVCAKLVKDGVQIARSYIVTYKAYDEGNLYNSVEGYFDPVTGKGYVCVYVPNTNEGYNNFNYAQIVEFGSGIRGSEGSAPDRPGWWELDRHLHGTKGWWFFKDGEWIRTYGQQPRPFMWNTYQELLERAEGLAKVTYRIEKSTYSSDREDADDLIREIGFID